MTLNIFYGGDELDLRTGDWCALRRGCSATFEQVIRTIRASGADVIGLEEAEHSTRRVARALGWYASERLQVVSRYRLIDPPGGNGLYVFVELAPGRVVAISNSHLPSDPYGPYLVRDGGTAEELDALERSTRLPAIQQQLAVLPGARRARDLGLRARRLQLALALRLDAGGRPPPATTCPSRSTGP